VEESVDSEQTTVSSSAARALKSPLVKMLEGTCAEIDQSKTSIDVVWVVDDEKSRCLRHVLTM